MTELSTPECCNNPMRKITANGHSAYFCATCYRSTVDAEPAHSCRAMAFVNRLLDPEDLGMAPRDEIRKAAAWVIG